MKKNKLLAIIFPMLFGGLITPTVVNNKIIDNDVIAYEETSDATKIKLNRKNVIINNEEVDSSETYVQYGKNTSTGNDILRFATAVKGNLKSLTYYYSYADNTREVSISSVYKGLNVNGTTTYYTDNGLSTNVEDAGQYYWACFTLEFKSEKQINTNFEAYLNIVDVNYETYATAAKATTLGDLKHKGYSVVNQTDNSTIVVPGENNSVTITNKADNCVDVCSHNMVLVNDKTYSGDYVISTDIVVPNVAFPVTKTYNQGLVVWYQDQNNYLTAYTNYQTDKANLLREVQLTGVLNGEKLAWGDFWTEEWDGFTADYINPSKANKLSVTKKGAKFYITLNDKKVGAWVNGVYQYYLDFSAYGDFTGESKVGYHVDTNEGSNTVQFSEIKLTKPSVDLYSQDNWTNIKGSGNVYTINEEAKSITSNNTTKLGNFLIADSLVSNNVTEDDCTLSVTISGGTMAFPNTKEAHVGFIPWYLDENNYVAVFLQWGSEAWERPNELKCIQMTGRINGEYLPVWNNKWDNTQEWNDMWTDGYAISASDTITLSITKKVTNGDSIRFNVTATNQDGVSVTRENGYGILNTGSLLSSGKVGLYSYNDTFTFTNLSKTLISA